METFKELSERLGFSHPIKLVVAILECKTGITIVGQHLNPKALVEPTFAAVIEEKISNAPRR